MTGLIIEGILFLLAYLAGKRRRRKRIEELTVYLETVNLSGEGAILQRKEDEFSLLEDEIYKTVTALYQTREAALAAKENYADNLANIAHQLKTPLTAASVALQLLQEKEEEKNGYSKRISRQLERLNALEEALLQLSRIDSGTLQLQRAPVDIFTVLTLAADNLCELQTEKKITVLIPERDGVMIWGDMDWTMEAFCNLMKNCMEHTSEGGCISCEYSQNPLYTEVRIWDNGEGFAQEDLPHLFQRFYRGKNAAGDGIGIGLALSRAIVELQNGTISAGNLHEGGAYFEIRFYSH